MLETFTFFPFIKPSIILWMTTHLLCVYRNKQHLSKMNSRRSEDSAEALLLSRWKLATRFMLHTSPAGITWVIGKCCQFAKGTEAVFLLQKWNPQLFFFFFKHLFLNNCFALLKGTATRLSQPGNINTKSTRLQSDPAQINDNTLNDLKSGRNFKQRYK